MCPEAASASCSWWSGTLEAGWRELPYLEKGALGKGGSMYFPELEVRARRGPGWSGHEILFPAGTVCKSSLLPPPQLPAGVLCQRAVVTGNGQMEGNRQALQGLQVWLHRGGGI